MRRSVKVLDGCGLGGQTASVVPSGERYVLLDGHGNGVAESESLEALSDYAFKQGAFSVAFNFDLSAVRSDSVRRSK